ncbi:MAG: hypothetical protein DRI80_18330 [Chloroflexota bacterium]|nr:MAG: hypothetical protein DRI80_18330 [Chloroflexota bacterium]
MSLERNDRPWLASLLFVGCLTLGLFALTAHRFTGGRFGVPLDDAWIHFQFARNLARGDGFSFNPGQPTAGSTAPLWTPLLAGVRLVGGEFPAAGQVLSAVCFLAALVTTYALGKRLTGSRWAAWLSGAIVATNGRFVWAGLSALEMCLFATLSLLATAAHLSDQAAGRYRLRTAAIFGLAALARPEGYLLFALALAASIWNTIPLTFHASRFTSHVSRLMSHALRLLLPVALFAAIVCPYLIFSLHTSGHLLPNTYHAKAAFDFRPSLDSLSVAAQYLILDNPILLPFYVLGLGILLRRVPLVGLWSTSLPLAYAFLHIVPYHHGRYLMPLIPCNSIISVVGLLEARRSVARRRPSLSASGRGLAALASLFVLAGTGWRLPAMAHLYAWNVDNINEMHVALGHWVADHTPPGALLALNDIGAITYISERPVIDLAGLVTPEVVPILRSPNRDARLAEFMAERGVRYVIIFPAWFPDLAARRDLLRPVHQVTLEHNTICGGQTMVVYRAHWCESRW